MIMNSSISTLILLYLCFLSLFTFPFVIAKKSLEINCISSEREALLKLKKDLKDDSNRLSSWNRTMNENCCEWFGVFCNNITSHVVQLHLNTLSSIDFYGTAYERFQFGGKINNALVDLKHLSYLDLSGNNFEGMYIPTFIGTITTLSYLNLSSAGFIGKIPHQIGNLTNLVYLDLHSYDYEPLFAENLNWLSGLSKLEYLDLEHVNLSKSFDWLQIMHALPSLMELHLSYPYPYTEPSSLNFSSIHTLKLSNTLYSEVSYLPKWIFGFTKLVSLQLSGNYIQGPIPDDFQNLTLLENLDMSYNLFSSSIPNCIYNLRHLKFLNLENSNLQGNISSAMGNWTSLVGLYLPHNQLEGNIPTSLGNLRNLREIDLSYNQLEGNIPSSLGNLVNLREIHFSHNQLEGKIPTSLSNLCNLREIDFSHLKLHQQANEFLKILTPCISNGLTTLTVESSGLSGNLVGQLGKFKNIEELDFHNNSICGALPREFGNLSTLKYLDLSNNNFNGNPFESFKSLSKLLYLDISDNLFEGVVKEDDLAKITNLQYFYASRNNISLKVSPDWHPAFQVTQLAMSSWKLGPNFPSWIQSLKHLEALEMSGTGISDSIPNWIWDKMSSVIYMNLSHNHIHGDLVIMLDSPTSFEIIDLSSNHLGGKLPRFSNGVLWLDLSNNTFSGPMTDFLCKRENHMQLQTLNLASNNLSGEIPDCWKMWSNLENLILKNNHFVGSLPPTMGSLGWLQLLDIRNNSLLGKFPTILNKTAELVFLDIGENNFSGNIPEWVGERLLKVKILCLRSNRFFGKIPNELCHMSSLQNLDLAHNNLSGNIPNCLKNLNVMMLKNKSTELFIACPNSATYATPCTASMLLWLKGRGTEYRNLLGLVTNIDLSHNNLFGGIPIGITNLDGLIFLNLSNNRLSGQIPSRIGNMISLESIDLSRNNLSGEIPSTLSNLSFLSNLNFSYNHLKGKIPTSTQLQTFEASDFVGNDLCGPPLPINCTSRSPSSNNDPSVKESHGHGVNGFYVSMTLGFVLGFWLVVAPLFIYRSWSFFYFRFLDDMWNKLKSC